MRRLFGGGAHLKHEFFAMQRGDKFSFVMSKFILQIYIEINEIANTTSTIGDSNTKIVYLSQK